jgi:hypothetical protein
MRTPVAPRVAGFPRTLRFRERFSSPGLFKLIVNAAVDGPLPRLGFGLPLQDFRILKRVLLSERAGPENQNRAIPHHPHFSFWLSTDLSAAAPSPFRGARDCVRRERVWRYAIPRRSEDFRKRETEWPGTALVDMRNSGGMAINRRELNRSSLRSSARLSMTMVALLRWEALMNDVGERRGADPAPGPGSETVRTPQPSVFS